MRIRSAVILGFVGFITSFGAHSVAVNLPVCAEQMGIGTAMIGLLIAAYDEFKYSVVTLIKVALSFGPQRSVPVRTCPCFPTG